MTGLARGVSDRSSGERTQVTRIIRLPHPGDWEITLPPPNAPDHAEPTIRELKGACPDGRCK